MTKITIFLLGLLTCSSLFAQKNRVFLGHKNVLEANYSIYMPLFSETSYYAREGSSLVAKKYSHIPQHGLQLCLTRHLSGKLAFGVEFDYGKSKYAPSSFRESAPAPDYYKTFVLENIDINCMAFIGRFEFGRQDGVFPIGISHQVGAGYMIFSPENESGTLLASSEYELNETKEVNYSGLGSAKGITAFYNLNFRASLSERLLINFGLRYNYTYVFSIDNEIYPEPIVSASDLSYDLRTRIGLNFIRIYTGLAFSF